MCYNAYYKGDESVKKIYLATNLKHLRLVNNKTQQDIAKVVGKGASAIGNYEQNLREPTAEDLGKLANYFNISVDDLVFRDLRLNTNIKRVNTLKEFIEDMTESTLTDEEYDNIMEFIKNNKNLFIKDK